jgi:hypothetical protein
VLIVVQVLQNVLIAFRDFFHNIGGFAIRFESIVTAFFAADKFVP